MRKSEAIQMIAEELDVVPRVSEAFSSTFPQTTAEAILDKMLKAGFKKPAIETKETINIPTSDGPPTSHEITVSSHEWED